MKLRLKKKDARVLLTALATMKRPSVEDDVRRVNLIDRITDRYPDYERTAVPSATVTKKT